MLAAPIRPSTSVLKLTNQILRYDEEKMLGDRRLAFLFLSLFHHCLAVPFWCIVAYLTASFFAFM